MFIRCTTHGSNAWAGEVMCDACGAVWKLQAPDLHEPPEPPFCCCGRLLVSTKKSEPEGTARVICRHCYKTKREQQQGAPS